MLIQMSEEYGTSEDKNDSEKCQLSLSEQAETIVKELNSMYGQAKGKIEELIDQLKKDKLKDHEIKQVLFSRVNFVSKRTLYRALPEDMKREYTKPLPKTINITTEHKVIEQPEEPKPISKVEPGQVFLKPPEELAENEVGEIDYWKEKAMELEEALKKTEQFKPATDIPIKGDNITHLYPEGEDFFSIMRKKADGVHSFYYDTYGIDLFRNRELSQLKNSGVKVFKRLFFEV